ncbi:hypothetical protein MCOR27_002496 [Pyricularia oryzae]|uniref:Protein FAF1 n=2 Tax=Pyricularia TaxID=48558 RepID=A0ABQ8NDW6_PYRGI|nr:hypothetical protein MCOR01_001281 [Pyricularia oryzae]KAI6294251.1 hypothetical protein MCOR33_008591 [Pyricularia grisea]KAI6277116.1 hypothetical protein MCOR26_005318 [Pyricularia oryzae]KAI6284942.1 hypothetical protein MCOR27_002496 [Pyricularia oryzae]KAI6304395.1 hypothetical protein MCOR34_008805 [Pyricularia oryzae]
MAPVLGKRKSRSQAIDSAAVEDAQEIFRRHFEAQFAPLAGASPSQSKTQQCDDEDDEDDDDEESGTSELGSDGDGPDEWGGLSGDSEEDVSEDDDMNDDQEVNVVEVVDYSSNAPSLDPTLSMSKKELKAYMSSRPPSLTTDGSKPKEPPARTKKKPGSDPEDSADLLANDLALQRLLSESHLLNQAAGNLSSSSMLLSSVSAANPAAAKSFAEGRLRRKTTDLRMQSLGAKESSFKQKSMPIAMRKGIVKAGVDKEARRRREAKECGVILETAKSSGDRRRPASSTNGNRRSKDVGLPGVGRMRGAELRISARDIRDVEGRRSTGGEKRRKRRR